MLSLTCPSRERPRPPSWSRSARALEPSHDLPHESLFAGLHPPEERICHVRSRVVLRAPPPHLVDHGQQIQRFLCRRIPKLPLVVWIAGLGDQTLLLEPDEPVGQNIRRNAFFGAQELVIALLSPGDHVPKDQQTPPVADRFQRE